MLTLYWILKSEYILSYLDISEKQLRELLELTLD